MYTRKISVPKALLDGRSVLLNAEPSGRSTISSVLPDEVEAGRTAARVVLDAGHREGIYLIGVDPKSGKGPADSLAAVQRLQGIKEVMSAAKVPLAGGVMRPDWQPAEGYEATRKLLKRAVPRALICFNDRLAVGTYQALQENAIKVPDEVSVVSFDDEPVASWLRPQLTTIAIPHYELGHKAIEVLLDDDAKLPNHKSKAYRVLMPLRERDSVRSVETKGAVPR
jgi:LacI family transcriptional regulator